MTESIRSDPEYLLTFYFNLDKIHVYYLYGVIMCLSHNLSNNILCVLRW